MFSHWQNSGSLKVRLAQSKNPLDKILDDGNSPQNLVAAYDLLQYLLDGVMNRHWLTAAAIMGQGSDRNRRPDGLMWYG